MSLKTLSDAMVSEVNAMRSGHFMPYHKLSVIVAVMVMILFGVVFSHGSVFEGTIDVIDLDKSQYSQDLIESINSSAYIRVGKIYHAPANVQELTRNDRCLGVLYLPHDLNKNLLSQKRAMHIGYFADYSNEAQNAEIIENLNEIIGRANGTLVVTNVNDDLGLSGDDVEAKLNPLSIHIRRLFNPTFSSTNATIISFIYFFSSLYLGLVVLMIAGRLRVTHAWEREVLPNGPGELIARLVPYSLFYTTAISSVTALLVLFGQLRFEGSYIFYLPSIFMTGMCFGMLGLLYAWNAQDPGQGASRMIFLVPPGFILGGATMAVGVIPFWAYVLSHAFPLVWQYRFWRDFALRGTGIEGMLTLYGMYLAYLTVLGMLIAIRFYKEQRAMSLPQKPPMLQDE